MIILLLIMLLSCTDNKIKEHVLIMNDSPINMNLTNCHTKYLGKDTVLPNTDNYKLVVFIDSLTCSTCFLSHLVDYYEINDSLQKVNGSTIIVINPKSSQINEIKSLLKYERHPLWCIIDEHAKFLKLNPHIPSERRFHTFLLDNNNNVILIGDPTKNRKIKSMIYHTLQY